MREHENGALDLREFQPLHLPRPPHGQRVPCLRLSEGNKTAYLNRAAHEALGGIRAVEVLASGKHPGVVVVRAAPPGSRYAVNLPKGRGLGGALYALLRSRQWADGGHPATMQDGVLVVRRKDGA